MSIIKDFPIYSVGNVLNTMKPYGDEEPVLHYISDLTDISIDTLLMMTGTEEQEDSSDDEILVYSIEDVLNTLKPYETEESVWSFVSDLAGISVDALLMMDE